jgi:hypothetical protein
LLFDKSFSGFLSDDFDAIETWWDCVISLLILINKQRNRYSISHRQIRVLRIDVFFFFKDGDWDGVWCGEFWNSNLNGNRGINTIINKWFIYKLQFPTWFLNRLDLMSYAENTRHHPGWIFNCSWKTLTRLSRLGS